MGFAIFIAICLLIIAIIGGDSSDNQGDWWD